MAWMPERGFGLADAPARISREEIKVTQQKTEPKMVPETDLDNLRSEKDKEVATAKKEAEDAKSALKQQGDLSAAREKYGEDDDATKLRKEQEAGRAAMQAERVDLKIERAVISLKVDEADLRKAFGELPEAERVPEKIADLAESMATAKENADLKAENARLKSGGGRMASGGQGGASDEPWRNLSPEAKIEHGLNNNPKWEHLEPSTR